MSNKKKDDLPKDLGEALDRMHWVLVSYAEESYNTERDGEEQTQLDADWDLIRNYAFKGAGSTLHIEPPLLEPSEGGYWSTGKNGKPIFWRD